MTTRLSNKYIPNLELISPIEKIRPETKSMFSTIAKSGLHKPPIYDGWILAGFKKQSDKNCGEWLRLGCLNSHNDNLLKMDHSLKKRNVFVKPFKRMCNQLGCTKCFIPSGVKHSYEIMKRFDLYQNYYGKKTVRHVIVSPSPNTSLDYLTMRKLANERLRSLGFIGWILIPHPFRVCRDSTVSTVQKNELEKGILTLEPKYENRSSYRHDLERSRDLNNPGPTLSIKNGASQEHVFIEHPTVSNRGFDKLGFHFHVVGFGSIDGKKQAKLFNDEKEEKMFVKALENKNRNVKKTLSYLLSHCGVHDKVHSITYNGSLSYSNRSLSKSRYSYGLDGKLHIDDYKKKEDMINLNDCPICKEKLRMLEYVGTDRPPDLDESYFDKSSNWKYEKEIIRNSNQWIRHLTDKEVSYNLL